MPPYLADWYRHGRQADRMNALPTPPIDGLALEPIAGAVPAWRAHCDAGSWLAAAAAVAQRGGRLAALWASDGRDAGQAFAVHAAFATYEGLLWLELPVPESQPVYPDLSLLYPCAGRMQRAAFDLMGLEARDADGSRPDARGWLRHGAWREDAHPLRRDVAAQARLDAGRCATTRSSRSRARACTRSRSARCTREPSSRAISASRSSASACCAWRSVSATSTRASKSASSP